MSLLNLKLQELHQHLSEKKASVTDLVEASLGRINRVGSNNNTFVTIDEEGARQRAASLDEKLAQHARSDDAFTPRGALGPLFGLPVGIKDNIVTEGLRTSAGSKILSNHMPVYDATVMQKLRHHHTVSIGKLTMDEFGMTAMDGNSQEGAAAAVAAREVYFAIGSDTGGGVRRPAADHGIVGMKPTYGLVSRFGLIGAAPSLDHIGLLSRNIEDTAYILASIAGHDPLDSTSSNVAIPDYIAALNGQIKGLKIGIPQQYRTHKVNAEVREAFDVAIAVLEGLGAICEEVSLPHTDYAVSTYYLLAAAEASSNLARLDGIRYGIRADDADNLVDLYRKSRSEGLGDVAKQRIIMGTYILSQGHYDDYFVKAQKVRTLIKQDFAKVFENYDLIIGPTAPTTTTDLDLSAMYANDQFTVPANLAGVPAVSLPCGFTANGLPIGLQLIGKAYDEATVLKVAHAFEQNTEHHQRPSAL